MAPGPGREVADNRPRPHFVPGTRGHERGESEGGVAIDGAGECERRLVVPSLPERRFAHQVGLESGERAGRDRGQAGGGSGVEAEQPYGQPIDDRGEAVSLPRLREGGPPSAGPGR
jgi:hypothetical protein